MWQFLNFTSLSIETQLEHNCNIVLQNEYQKSLSKQVWQHLCLYWNTYLFIEKALLLHSFVTVNILKSLNGTTDRLWILPSLFSFITSFLFKKCFPWFSAMSAPAQNEKAYLQTKNNLQNNLLFPYKVWACNSPCVPTVSQHYQQGGLQTWKYN